MGDGGVSNNRGGGAVKTADNEQVSPLVAQGVPWDLALLSHNLEPSKAKDLGNSIDDVIVPAQVLSALM